MEHEFTKTVLLLKTKAVFIKKCISLFITQGEMKCQKNKKLTNDSKIQVTLGHPRYSWHKEEHLAGPVLKKLN